MNKLLDKFIIFILCSFLYFYIEPNIYAIVTILIALSFNAFLTYLNNKTYKLIIYFCYLVSCFILPKLTVFLPVFTYDIFYNNHYFYLLFAIIPFIWNFNNFNFLLSFAILSLCFISLLLKFKNETLDTLKSEYIKLRDKNKEFENNMKEKNKELIEMQDYEVNIATLNERNRIARDIHDLVGHLLSSSILQLGALMLTVKDEKTKSSLSDIKTTLDTGMNNIRNSIHNLYNDSINLEAELNKIVYDFTFCNISLDYNSDFFVSNDIKYTVIAIVKEALTNIIKHSNATDVYIAFREHPSLYQLVVEDNGKITNKSCSNGIGLNNIAKRVEKLEGYFNISKNKGFKLFISIPKKGVNS